MRNRSIDVGRGLLVLMMVYGHVLQFFADTQLFPLADTLMNLINLTVFPTFVFYFGMTAAIAYLNKPYRSALRGMAGTMLRTYAAFVLSGVGYRVLRENKPFAAGTVRRVMLLQDIPGWSEFLIAFSLYMLVLIVLFPLIKGASCRPGAALAAGIVCMLCCELIPYKRIAPPQLALLIGGRDFSYFPVVQYMPYFLSGLVYAQAHRGTRRRILFLATAASVLGLIKYVINGRLPSRFPPDWAWIALPALLVALVAALANALCAPQGGRLHRISAPLCRMLSHLGGKSLYYLLMSNLVLFTMSGKGIVPQLSRKGMPPWTKPIQSPAGALCWTAVLLVCIAYSVNLAGRGARRAENRQKAEYTAQNL